MPSIVITEEKDVFDQVVKRDEFNDIWWEALESKTYTKEGIPEALEMDKSTVEETIVGIACDWVAKNF